MQSVGPGPRGASGRVSACGGDGIAGHGAGPVPCSLVRQMTLA